MSDSSLVRAVLKERVPFSEEIARFRFELETLLDFEAGQYATLVVETENGKIARPYSICSAPGDKTLEFYCDLEPRGEFTPLAWDMTVGSEIFVQDEAGGSLLFNPDLEQHLMVATVTGAGP
ncbi:MAG: ferredoxin--NADP reductase, partial [Candidatus Eisenbacteria bacterium]|nr:ferredoxin--NADP reductase [Candidatus Eisenbacteria bacterium]